jgi:peptidoglycan/LPS O-acetylase OafA/YrhL
LGTFSVILFFLISGYLIVKSWDNNNNIRAFLLNRILRIYPGFIVASIISCFLIGPFVGYENYFKQFNYRHFIEGLFLLNMPRTPHVFPGSFFELINASMWTINNEFVCYILVLLLGVFSLIKKKIGWLLFFTTFFLIVFIGQIFNLKIITIFLSNYIVKEFVDIYCIFSFFIGGTYYLFGRPYLNRKPIIIISAILMLVSFYFNYIVEYALPIFGGYIALSFAVKTIPILLKFNKLPDISYGIYLYGWPISKVLIYYQPKINFWMLNVESMVLAVLFGLFSWYFIEKHFIMLKPQIDKITQ